MLGEPASHGECEGRRVGQHPQVCLALGVEEPRGDQAHPHHRDPVLETERVVLDALTVPPWMAMRIDDRRVRQIDRGHQYLQR